jgi:flagellar biosynthesis protein FliR
MKDVFALSIPYFDLIHVAVVFVRVGAALFFSPIWGHPGLPHYLRILLVLSTSLMISEVTAVNAAAYSSPALLIPTEFLIGLLLCMGIRIAFAGLHLAGQLIGYYLGFSTVQTIDPSTANRSTMMANFLTMAGYALILATNQHHTILRTLIASYNAFPVGSIIQPAQWFDNLFSSAAQIFVVGWKIALPVFVATLLVEIAVGLVSRMQPQINMMIVSAPLKLCVGLLALGASLAFLPRALGGLLDLTILRK